MCVCVCHDRLCPCMRLCVHFMALCVCVSSSPGPHAHRCVHFAAAERREELWGAAEQALPGARSHGHPRVHGLPRRPAHRGERASGLGSISEV